MNSTNILLVVVAIVFLGLYVAETSKPSEEKRLRLERVNGFSDVELETAAVGGRVRVSVRDGRMCSATDVTLKPFRQGWRADCLVRFAWAR